MKSEIYQNQSRTSLIFPSMHYSFTKNAVPTSALALSALRNLTLKVDTPSQIHVHDSYLLLQEIPCRLDNA